MVHELTAANAAQRLAWVHLWWRATHPRPRTGHILYVAYVVVLLAAMYGLIAYGTVSSTLPGLLDPRALAAFGPSVLLAGLMVAARWGLYQGPVVFSPPDIAFLLGAPLSRRALATRHLARALAGGAGVGMLLGGAALVGLVGDGRGIAADRATGLVVGFAELGVLGVAGAWAVQCSAHWEAALTRTWWPAMLVAAAAAAAAATIDIGRRIVLWSGPWGWAAQPGTGVDRLEWIAALALLTLVTSLAAAAALRRVGDCPTERHARRAEGRAGAAASLTSFDARTARQALETVAPKSPVGTTRGLRRLRAAIGARGPGPKTGRLAVVWRDAVAAAGAPARTIQGAALVAAGTVLAFVEPTDPIALPTALIVTYVGASRLLATLRSDLDATPRARVLLRPPLGAVLLAHTVVPAVIAGTAACLADLGSAVTGELPIHGGAAAAVAIGTTAVITGCAAMSARRAGRMPPALVAVGSVADPSGGGVTVITWLLFWPLLATMLGALPVTLVNAGGPGRGLIAAAWIAAVTTVLARLLARQVPDA